MHEAGWQTTWVMKVGRVKGLPGLANTLTYQDADFLSLAFSCNSHISERGSWARGVEQVIALRYLHEVKFSGSVSCKFQRHHQAKEPIIL